jgi:hypothetical protein
MCDPGDGFGGGEAIFKISHTKQFVGICRVAPEALGACAPLNQGRWVYEGEEKKSEPNPI